MRTSQRRSITAVANAVKVAVTLTAFLLSAPIVAAQTPQGGAVPGGVAGGVLGAVAQAPPPSPPPASPVRVGGSIKPPVKIRHVNPEYPTIAQSARVQGVVIIDATIAPNGLVTNARILRSIPLLDQAALDAVRQWQYQPTLLDGVPIPVIMTVTVQFTLQGAEAVARDCSLEANLRSSDPPVPSPTAVTFDNQSGETRKLYRLDTDGRRVLDSTIGVGIRLEKPSTVGQAWLIATDDDRCVAIYVATAAPTTATLHPRALSQPVADALRNRQQFVRNQPAQHTPRDAPVKRN